MVLSDARGSPNVARMAHEQAASGANISMSGARAAYVGPGLDLAPHRNAVATIALSRDQPFELAFPGIRPRAETHHVAVIPPGTLHHLRAGGDVIFLYLDALSDDFRSLEFSRLSHGRARICETPVSPDVDSLCNALGVPPRPAIDPRLSNVVRRIDVRPQDFAAVDDAAQLVGVSSSRFQALFRQSVGLSFRRYRLWRRMALVVRSMSKGRSMTDAAHQAGFASSAHLSAAFRAMFGLSPSRLAALDAAYLITDAAPHGSAAAS